MKIVKMDVSSFWKGEVGVRGRVEEEGTVFDVQLYLSKDRVRDYSCSCKKGDSYRGMCSHEEALFAYYREKREEASKPLVHTCPQIQAMIREYTNEEVARILSKEEESRVHLEPVMMFDGKEVSLGCKAGITRFYELKDLSAFKEAVEHGAYVSYGRELAFYHHKTAFSPESRGLLSLITGLTGTQGPMGLIPLSRMSRDVLFDLVSGQEIEIRLWGVGKQVLCVGGRDPILHVKLEKTGRDGLRITLSGLSEGTESPRKVEACFRGERFFYAVAGTRFYRFSEEGSRVAGPFLEQMSRERGRWADIGSREIPLFYERVLKQILPFCRLELCDVDLKAYEPEPLKAVFYFDTGEEGRIIMEPILSYGTFSFHPLEDENLPRTVCRDVPQEVRVSQLIRKYFKYRDPAGEKLTMDPDEETVYRFLTEGLEEFSTMGQVEVSETLRQWTDTSLPQISVGVQTGKGWLDLTVDTGGMDREELRQILLACSTHRKFCRLKSGRFLRLEEGGLADVGRMAAALDIREQELLDGHVRIPSYRAFYLDHLLKGSQGLSYYRDQLLKAMVRAVKSVEDSDLPMPLYLEGKLREYQKIGYLWLRTLDSFGFGGILADDMGLGKTVQVIALLEAVYEEGEKAPSLVVCPASLVYNWEHEARRFAPNLTILSAVGKNTEREELLERVKEDPSGVQLVITSYDLLKRDIEAYGSIHFRYQIIDEAQYIKNAATQSAKAVKSLDVQTRFALTGTPVENRLGELWSIFDYLMPGFLFTYSRFRREYEIPIVREGNGERLAQLKSMIGPFVLRRVKGDVLKELPDKAEKVVYSVFGQEQRRLYAAHAAQFKEKLENGGFGGPGEGKIEILSELMRLRQLCCDPRLCYDHYEGGSAKLDTCMDLIRRAVEGGHKILLFSQFTSMLDLIRERLEQERICSHMLTGATSKEERIRLTSEFAKDRVPVFLISLKAGGTGLNLTAADIVIHYDPWWNAAAQNQATDRTHRIGQKKQVTVYRMVVRDTIEENILKLQESKRFLADAVVPEGVVSLASMTKEDILNALSGEA